MRVHLVTCYNTQFLLNVIDVLKNFNLEITTLNRRKLPNGQYVVAEKDCGETFAHSKFFIPKDCRRLVRTDYEQGVNDPFLHNYTDTQVELFVDANLGYVGFDIPSLEVKKFQDTYWQGTNQLTDDKQNLIIRQHPHLKKEQKDFALRVKERNPAFHLVE